MAQFNDKYVRPNKRWDGQIVRRIDRKTVYDMTDRWIDEIS